MFRTRVTALLGVEYPIIQSGMFWTSNADFVATISNAGGLGILSALSFSQPTALAEEIERVRTLTKKPFGVNITLSPNRKNVNYDKYLDLIIDNEIEIVETAGSNPGPLIDQLKGQGIKVIHRCHSVRQARDAQKSGCDLVAISGFESAGYLGENDVGSLVLIPAAVDALKVPVIAAGGIADGRGLVAALALGAEGVAIGTRFLLTEEAPVHSAIKGWLLQTYEHDTVVVSRSRSDALRVLTTPLSKKICRLEKDKTPRNDITPLLSEEKTRELLETGDFNAGVLPIGQSAGLIKDISSAAELIVRIIAEAREILNRLANRQN